jgi:hypothetical protein
MDMYIKQLLSEINQSAKNTGIKLKALDSAVKKAYAETTANVSSYEQYYQLIRNADDERVTPGQLPFSVYSRPEPTTKISANDESEDIAKMLDDKKKVFERSLKSLKLQALSIEQILDDYTSMIIDLQEYYEDLIEGLKF